MDHWDYLSLALLSLLAVGGAVWLFGALADMLDQPD
jgi:hypothetical protein